MTLNELNKKIECGELSVEDVTAEMIEHLTPEPFRPSCPECHGKGQVVRRVPEVGCVYDPQTYEVTRSYFTGRTIWRDVTCPGCQGTGLPLFEEAS